MRKDPLDVCNSIDDTALVIVQVPRRPSIFPDDVRSRIPWSLNQVTLEDIEQQDANDCVGSMVLVGHTWSISLGCSKRPNRGTAGGSIGYHSLCLGLQSIVHLHVAGTVTADQDPCLVSGRALPMILHIEWTGFRI